MKQPARKQLLEDDTSLTAYWSEVQPGLKRARRAVQAPVLSTVAPLISWAVADEATRPALCVVPGEAPQRTSLLQQFTLGEWRRFQEGYLVDHPQEATWLSLGVVHDLTRRVERLALPKEVRDRFQGYPAFPQGSWEVLWALVWNDDFIVEEPLRGVVDQSFYLMHDVYRAIWEARFFARENGTLKPLSAFMQTLTRWMTGETLSKADLELLGRLNITRHIATELERLDVLCFVLTLAAQNDVLCRTVFVFDQLENALTPEHKVALRQLHTLFLVVSRWVHLGLCPAGVLLGFRGLPSDFTKLKKLHPKLAGEVAAHLCRDRPPCSTSTSPTTPSK